MPEPFAVALPKFEFGKFFIHKLKDNRSLLITDLGRIAVLSQEEFTAMQRSEFSEQLFKKLEQAHIIATEKNRPKMVEDYRLRFGHVCEGVSLHIVNPTMRCNQNCLYCYANSKPLESKGFAEGEFPKAFSAEKGFDMDLETAKKIVDFAWQSPSKGIVIEFQGGEPLANFPIIEYIVNYAKEKKGKNVHWRLVSNLTLMDGTIASFLQKNEIFDLCTSLDGQKEVHDKNRPMAKGSSHAKTVYWIERLQKEFGFKNLGALCTVTKNSLPFAKEIVDSYAALGFHDITLVPLRKIGLAAKNWEKIGYGPEQYLSFWKQAVEYCIQLSRQGRQISEQIAALSLAKMNRVEPSHHTCFSKPCGAALMQCSYQPNGDIFSCDEAKAVPIFRIGNVEQTYKQVFTSPEALNIVSLSTSLGFACNECKFTGFCRLCPAMIYSTQGNLVPKLAFDEECKTKKAQFEFLLEKLFSTDAKILQSWLGGKGGN